MDELSEQDIEKRFVMIEAEVRNLSFAIFGLEGTNGMRSEVKALRREFKDYVEEEQDRRDQVSKDKLSGQRAVILALLAAMIALIGTIASLAVAVGV
jgi:hypothetical protein